MSEFTSQEHAPVLVRAAQRVEESPAAERLAGALSPVASAVVGSGRRRELLRGTWFGHAIHPPMTVMPLGMWTAATVLDLVGGADARTGSRRLVGMGVLMALPTALTGLAEWTTTGEREGRVGAVHAAANGTALVLFTASYGARRKGRQFTGVALALAGGVAASVGGFLGGHLSEVRKVASYHPAFDSDQERAA
jgi:uncharacterized membrane protein